VRELVGRYCVWLFEPEGACAMSQMQQQQFATGPEKEPEYAEFPSAADEADIMGTLALSSRKRFLRRFKSNKGAMVAFGFLVFLLIIAVIGPWIAPHDPN